jgi:hypothetical protein
MHVNCPSCKLVQSVPDAAAGKSARCSNCKAIFPIPVPAPVSDCPAVKPAIIHKRIPSWALLAGALGLLVLLSCCGVAGIGLVTLLNQPSGTNGSTLLEKPAKNRAEAARQPSKDNDKDDDSPPGRQKVAAVPKSPANRGSDQKKPTIPPAKVTDLKPDSLLFDLEKIFPKLEGRFGRYREISEVSGNHVRIVKAALYYRVRQILGPQRMLIEWRDTYRLIAVLLIEGLRTADLADGQLIEDFGDHLFEYVGTEKVGSATLRKFKFRL